MKDLVLDVVSKSYDSNEVLKKVSLTVRKGEFIAIVGPSGSGKTTVLGIMGGLEKPSSGLVLYDGEDLATFDDKRLARYRNRNVGFVHQTFNLVPFLTATENVMVPMIIAGKRTSDASTRSAELLASVGLKEKAKLLPRQLSGGEQQRVAVARALCNGPDIILADEPTANLDEHNQRMVLDYLQRLPESAKAVVLATHDVAQAGRASKRYVMEEGALRGI